MNVSTLRSTAHTFDLSNQKAMRTLFDSMIVNRIQMESFSNDVLLNCFIYEEGQNYETDVVLDATAMNQFLIELAMRGIELDFETNSDTIQLPDGEIIQSLDLSKNQNQTIYLPLYCLPAQARLLRA